MSKESTRERVRAHRANLRHQGLRPLQIWVPDSRSAEFATEARRQCLAISASALADEDLGWIEDMAYWPEVGE